MNMAEPAILFENDDVVAINKPAGLMVHSDGRTKDSTLSDWVLAHYPQTEDVGEPIKLSDGSEIKKHGIVHRLDRETSGVMLVAKNQETFLSLKQQFQERSVKKVYRAIVHGTFKSERGTVDKQIGKSRGDFRQWATGKGARGVMRDAVTEYKVLSSADGFSYIEVFPKTGRTHQIRVHMKALDRPIVCDRLYAPGKDCALDLARIALHALSIGFTLRDGAHMRVEAPPPEDFARALRVAGLDTEQNLRK